MATRGAQISEPGDANHGRARTIYTLLPRIIAQVSGRASRRVNHERGGYLVPCLLTRDKNPIRKLNKRPLLAPALFIFGKWAFTVNGSRRQGTPKRRILVILRQSRRYTTGCLM